jgi:hypothetical protein
MKHENKIKEQCLAEPLDFIGETTTRKRPIVQQTSTAAQGPFRQLLRPIFVYLSIWRE